MKTVVTTDYLRFSKLEISTDKVNVSMTINQ